MDISSGPTREWVTRTALTGLLLVIGAVWFAADGWSRWPEQNASKMREKLTPQQADSIRVTDYATEKLAREGRNRVVNSVVREDALRVGEETRYYGHDGYISVPDNPSAAPAWFAAPHTRADLVTQKIIAGGLAVAAVVFAVKFSKVRATRMTVGEAGIKTNTNVLIPWEAVTSLNSSGLKEKGWVDLVHTGGTLRIDAYHYAEFDDIVSEICRRKGFANPIEAAAGA